MKNNVKSIGLFLLFFIYYHNSFSQNLCPNPGFEQLSGCPVGSGEINLAQPWSGAGIVPDLFSFCHVNGTPAGCNDVSVPANFAGNTTAHGGSAYAGFYTKRGTANQRTYLQAPFTTPLVNGQLYRVTAWFRRSGFSKYATNRIGITLSTNALSQTGNQFIPVTPQAELTNVIADTGSWTSLTSYYVAVGGEAYITIGNFRNDANTTAFNFAIPSPACTQMNTSAFYYVDDVSVTTIVEQLSVIGDTVICTGQSTALQGVTNTAGWWSAFATPTDTLPSVNNVLGVTPAVTTTYLWNGIESSYSVTVSVVDPPQFTLPADTIVCESKTVLLDATCTGCTYIWSTGETTAQIQAADGGWYVVSANNGGCIVKDSFLLDVLATPDVILNQSIAICPDNDEKTVLDAGLGDSYLWLPGNETTQTIIVALPGAYSVVVSHGNGCTKSDSTIIAENCPEVLFIPGAFTPNNDGKNDLFYADGTNVKNYEIVIYSRWGQKVFETKNIGLPGGWNGKFNDTKAPEGLYNYIVTYDAIQVSGKSKPEKRTGYFTLLR